MSNSKTPAQPESKSKKEDSSASPPPKKGSSFPWVTRSKEANDISLEREKFLSMPLEEKRKLYKCSKKFKTLDDVPKWPEFYQENKKRLKKAVSKKKLPKLYPVNEEINNRVSIWKGDITTLEIDAIANAANNSLLGGGGVDGAIHSAAGRKLVQECMTLNGCDTGHAKITAGYKLPAKYVIHTVGPIGEKQDLLYNAYSSVLRLLKENNLASVAFPCISTGIYGYPSEKAAHVALKTVREFLEKENTYKSMDRVIFCLFMPKDVAIYEEQMQAYFPILDADDEDDTVDVEMESCTEEICDEKKSVKTKKKEEMVSDEKEDSKLKASEDSEKIKSKTENKEEKMDTEEKEIKENVKVDKNVEKNTKEKAADTKEEKMDTSDDKVHAKKDEDGKSDKTVENEDNHSKTEDSMSDKSPSKTEKQTTEKEKSGSLPKKEETSSKEQSVGETGNKDEKSSSLSGQVLTRKALNQASDLNPKKKQAKI